MKELRKLIVQSAHKAREGHIPSALSILDILWVLYDKILDLDLIRSGSEDRDRFILSKGQAALGLYVVLAEKGFINKQDLRSYCAFDSHLGGHPDRNQIPGVEASTGSLGHGFPMAVGLALGAKIKRKSNRIFCLIGDGECNEGSVWEAVLLASHHHLNNLCCIVDYNHSTDRALFIGDITDKFRSFEWETTIIQGHDQLQIEEALRKHPAHPDKPYVVIVKTVKGYGVPSMENNPAWHHRAPTAEEMEQLKLEIESYE